jgi:hypothetical protein
MADASVPDTVPEDEELLDEEDDGMGDEGFAEDMLLSVLTTEDGETITSVLSKLSDSTDAIAKHLEKQNVILVKILTALSARQAVAPQQ